MNGTNTMSLEHFEVVTAITQMYADDIESYLIKEYDEVLQIDFAELVMNLYFEYTKDTTGVSLLSMNGEKTMNLEHFEVVTAITQIYEDDIESYLIKEYDEALQIDFAELVMNLYFEYTKDTTAGSLLSMINKKVIPLSQVIEN